MRHLSVFLLAALSATAQTVSIGPAVFSGSGLNDATSGGRYSPAAANAQYLVVQSAAGAPDQFVWSKNGGAASLPVNMTGAAQTLTDGVTVTFAASTGHGTSAGTISAATWTSGSNGWASYVTAAPNALVSGQSLFVAGVSPSGYNQLCVALVYSATQFSCPLASNPGAYTSGGTVTLSGVWTITAQASGSPFTTVAAGPGALVARSGQTKIQEFGASVKDYGAKGDGVTDDTAAFNLAYANASLSPALFGAVIHVPASPNCYMVTSVNRRSGVALIGDGPNSTCIKQIYVTGVSQAMLIFPFPLPQPLGYNSNVPMHDEVIQGLTLDGNRAAQSALAPAQGSQVIFVYGGDRMIMRDLVVKNAATDGIYIVGAGPGTPAAATGTYLQDIPGHDLVIDNVHVSNSSRNNISVVCVDGLSISNSSFEGAVGQSPQAGMDIEPNYPTQVVDHIRVTNSRFTGNATRGINVALLTAEPNFNLSIDSTTVMDNLLMGSNNLYSAGTVQLTNGSTAVVGTSTAWQNNNVNYGHTIIGTTLFAQNATATVAGYTDATHITLAAPWTGTGGSGLAYTASMQTTGRVLLSGIYDCTTQLPTPCSTGLALDPSTTINPVLSDFTAISTGQALYMEEVQGATIGNGYLSGGQWDIDVAINSSGIALDKSVVMANHFIRDVSNGNSSLDDGPTNITANIPAFPQVVKRFASGAISPASNQDLTITLGTANINTVSTPAAYADSAGLIGGLTNASLGYGGHICLGTATDSNVMTKGLCQDKLQNLTAPGTFALTGAFSASAVSSASDVLAATYMQTPKLGIGLNPLLSPLSGSLVSPNAPGGNIVLPVAIVNDGTVSISGTAVTGTGTSFSANQGILNGYLIINNINCGTVSSVGSTTSLTLSASTCTGQSGASYYIEGGYGWDLSVSYSSTNPDLIFYVHGAAGNLQGLRLDNTGQGYFASNVYANGSMLITAASLSGYAPIASPTFTGTVTAPKLVVTSGSDTFTMDATGSNPNYAVTDGTDIVKLQMVTGTRGLVGTQTNVGFGIYTNNTERLDFTAAGAANFLGSLAVGGAAVATQSYVTGLGYATTASLSSYAQLSSANFTVLQLGGATVATQSYVTGLGYATSASVASTYAPLASPLFSGSVVTSASGLFSWTGRTYVQSRADGVLGLFENSGSTHLYAQFKPAAYNAGFGTLPTVAGVDSAGRVTVGTGGTATTGNINFGLAWNTAPACTANDETTVMHVQATATTTLLTLTSATAWGAGDKLTWLCFSN